MAVSDEEAVPVSQRYLPRLLVRGLGAVVALVCCYFVFRAIQSTSLDLGPKLLTSQLLVAALGCSFLWVCLNVFLGLLWRALLRFGGGEISRSGSICLSFETQVAKYLPGNVFHMAGRVALAGQYGVTKAQAAFATLAEAAVLLIVAGSIASRLVFAMRWGGHALAGIVLGLAAVLFVLRKPLRSWMAGIAKKKDGCALAVGKIIGFSVVVFTIQAVMFVWVELALFEDSPAAIVNRIELVASSWAAGFVVVGSPGGIGVREFVISRLASGEAEVAKFALVATITRICSMVGDSLSFLFGIIYGRMTKERDG